MVEEPKNRKKKNKKGLSIIITFILIILILATYLFCRSDYFLIDNIEVLDNHRLTEKEVLELSNIERGSNIFYQDLKSPTEKIIQRPYIKDVKISRKLPDTIIIEVIERTPLAIIISSHGEFFKIDKDKVCLEKIDKVSRNELPMITGIEVTNNISPGKNITAEGISVGIETARILWNHHNAQDYFNEIRVLDENNIVLYTFEDIEIRFGDINNMRNKFELFKSVYEIKKEKGKLDNLEYIDVRYDKLPIIKHKDQH